MNGNPSQSNELVGLNCFTGGGEMGALMRSFDWAATPLGPVSAWPKALCTSINICLNSRFAILIWWGPDRIMLYNDAYRQIIAGKHPAALGHPGRQCWPEIWHIIGPMLQEVLEKGRATWSDNLLLLLERHGYPEECYFTFSYSPIWDETGRIAGVFTPVKETTEEVIGERRLRTLGDLAARNLESKSKEEACRAAAGTLAANPYDIPFALLYLLDESRREARLEGVTGLENGTPASPLSVNLEKVEASSAGWPLAEVAQTGRSWMVEGLGKKFGSLPGGGWPVPPHSALVLPILQPGQRLPKAIFVAAVSPRKALDREYRRFYDLVAGQISAAIANAAAHEEERKRLETLAELDRAKTAFFSNISHEFRTPLTLILGPMEDLLSRAEDTLSQEDRERIALVYGNGLRLLKLVNTLLDFSRMEAGRAKANYEPTDLSTFTADLASLFRSAVEKAGMRLLIDCPPLSESVYVDREMWEKIVLNLVSNAFKFTFEGEIEVKIRQTEKMVELSVRDTGSGIPAEEMPNLFERFHRVQGAHGRTMEGTGIGLSLVQELAKLHGGSISVKSKVGHGSTFTVSIPLGFAHLPAEQVGGPTPLVPIKPGAIPYVEEATRWISGAGAVGDRPENEWMELHEKVPPEARLRSQQPKEGRILVAEDNADMRAYVTRLLSGRYEVEGVADGADALAAVRRRTPDLVLTDVMMPGLDGFQLLKEIRADPRLNTVPVILLSARAGEESKVEGLEAGADDYLIKPFSGRELLARVEAHLEMTRLRKEAEESLRKARDELELRVQERTAELRSVVKRLEREIAERKEADETINGLLRISHILNSTLNLDNLMDSMVKEAIGFANAEGGCSGLRTPEGMVTHRYFLRSETLPFDYCWPPSRGLPGWIILHKAPYLTNDALSDKQIAPELVRRFGWKSALSTPILDGQNEVIGFFELHNKEGGFSVSDQEKLEAVSQIASSAIQNALAYQRILQAEEALRESEEKFRLLVTGVRDYAIFMMDPGGRIMSWNEGAERIKGYREEEIIGRHFSLFYTPEDIASGKPDQALNRAATEGRWEDNGWRVRKDGSRFWANVLITALRDEKTGELKGFAKVTRDMTRHKRAEDDIRKLNEELEHRVVERTRELQSANKELESFAYSVSHDLRAPLRAISGFAEIIAGRHRSRLNEEGQHYADNIVRAAERMGRLIDDLLAYSRLGRQGVRFQPVPLRTVMGQVMESFSPRISETGAEVSIPEDLPVVEGDPTLISQIFTNLLDNALLYHRKDLPPRVHVTYQEEDDFVTVCLADNGIGIAPEYYEKIFNVFQRLHSEEEYPGTGVGLAIVKKSAELLGGQVWVESAPGKGSTFCIKLKKTNEK